MTELGCKFLLDIKKGDPLPETGKGSPFLNIRLCLTESFTNSTTNAKPVDEAVRVLSIEVLNHCNGIAVPDNYGIPCVGEFVQVGGMANEAVPTFGASHAVALDEVTEESKRFAVTKHLLCLVSHDVFLSFWGSCSSLLNSTIHTTGRKGNYWTKLEPLTW
jgi:hypothetical protein